MGPKVNSPVAGWGAEPGGHLTPETTLFPPMPEASLGVHPLMLEGWLTQPQPPRGHLARTPVTDSAAEATGPGPGPGGQLAGEATAPEEAQEEGSRGQGQ